jgi:hypothetical protein
VIGINGGMHVVANHTHLVVPPLLLGLVIGAAGGAILGWTLTRLDPDFTPAAAGAITIMWAICMALTLGGVLLGPINLCLLPPLAAGLTVALCPEHLRGPVLLGWGAVLFGLAALHILDAALPLRFFNPLASLTPGSVAVAALLGAGNGGVLLQTIAVDSE